MLADTTDTKWPATWKEKFGGYFR